MEEINDFQRNIETELLVQHLLRAEERASLSYEDLNLVVNGSLHSSSPEYKDVRPGNKGYGYLRSAREIVERDHGKTFRAIPKYGIKHVVDAREFVDLGRKGRSKVRRACIKGSTQLGNAKLEEMEPEDRGIIMATVSLFQMVKMAFHGSHVKKVSELTNGGKDLLPVEKTIEFFSKHD